MVYIKESKPFKHSYQLMIGKLTLVIWCRDNLFQLFNWFQLFFCKKEIPKIAVHMYSQNRSKMTFLKRGVDGFSYFSLIFNYFIFYSESSLLVEPTIICSFQSKNRPKDYLNLYYSSFRFYRPMMKVLVENFY